MAYDGSLIFDTKIDTKGFSSGTNTIKSQANSLKSTFVSLGKVIAGAFVIKKSINVGKQATELASDLQEVQNVVDVAFGDMAYKVENFAKTSIENFGLSKLAAKQMASTYMAMYRGMGQASGMASDMAVDITARLGDVMSFFNKTQTEVDTIGKAIATGETEPLKAIGVVATETNLALFAMQNGFEKAYSEMSAGEKLLVRQQYFLEKTSLAAGDFARTSDSWANQTRVLKERWKEFLIVMGNGLIQILTPAMRFLNSAMTYMIALAKAVGQVLSSVFGLNIQISNSTQNVSSGAADAADNVTAIGDAAEEAGEKAAKAIAPFDKLNQVASADVTGGAGQAIDSINTSDLIDAGGALNTIDNNIGNVDRKIQDMVEKIKPILQNIVDLFGKIKPLIIGIAEAFIAYKIVDWFMNLGGAIGALNPTAGVIALAVLAFGTIYSAIKDYNQKLVAEDLASRFGEIVLSLEDIEEIAGRLTESKYTANIDVYVNEEQKLSELEQNIETDLDTINKLNWKISVGMKLTPDEISTYSATIDKFVTDTNAYIEQQHYVASLSVDVVAPDDASFNAEMKKLIDEYYAGTKGDMAQLGKNLRSAMDEAVADGVIDEAEQKVINNLIGEINEITSRVADAQFLAKLQGVTVDGELTPDSFKDLNKRIQEIIQERIDVADEAAYTMRANVNAAYTVKMEDATTQKEKDAIQKEWDGTLQEITDNLSNTKAEITFSGTTFATDKLYEKYESELTAMGANIKGFTRETFSKEFLNGLKEVDPNRAVTDFMSVVEGDYQMAWELSGMDGISAEGLKQMLEELKPTAEQNKELYDWYIETGKIPPKALTDQMTAYSTLEALAGQDGVDGMYYAIGQQMADSPEILKMIANGEMTAALLPDGVIRGIKSKHPELKLAGENLIVEVDSGVKKEAKNSADNHIKGYVGGMIVAVSGAFEKDKTAEKAVKTWLGKVSDAIKTFQLPTMEVKIGVNTAALEAFRKGTQAAGISLPAYASGTVVPANYGNFLAVLGDNKREPEVVSPISTMEQAMENVLNRRGGAGNGQAHYTIKVGNKVIFEGVVEADREHRAQTGKSAFEP